MNCSLQVGNSIQNYGHKDLPGWVANCDAKTALAAARRMKKLEVEMARFFNLMPETKWDGLVEMQEIMSSPNWKQFRRGDEKSMSQFLRTPGERGHTRAFSDHQIQSHYLSAMNQALARAKRPFSRDIAPIAPAADPFSEHLSEVFTGSTDKNWPLRRSINWARTFATHRLVQTAFALQAFQQTHSKYPQFLNELVSKYLQRVPRDPFAPDWLLHYQSDGKTFTLYSIGPDAVDNNGSPILRTSISGKSLGDLVFGYGFLRDGRAQNL